MVYLSEFKFRNSYDSDINRSFKSNIVDVFKNNKYHRLQEILIGLIDF